MSINIRANPNPASEAPQSGRVNFNLTNEGVDDDYISQLEAMQQRNSEPRDQPVLTLNAMEEFLGTPARPGGDEQQQKKANSDKQSAGIMTADELAQMFENDSDDNNGSDEEKPIQQQLLEFNEMITAEVGKINYITPDLSQKIINAMSGKDEKGTENFIEGMNSAMRNVAVNALNTSFSMLHHHIQKAVATAVTRANSARDFDGAFSELISSMPEHYGSDPIRRAFLQKTMRDFSRKAPNLRVAAKMTKTFVESMSGNGGNKSSNSHPLPQRMSTASKMLGLSQAQSRTSGFGSIFK